MIENKLSELEKVIEKDYANTTGVAVRKGGETVYEHYFGDYSASEACHVFSVTKSVFSALIGIAIGEGRIESLSQPVLDFFPDYTVKRGEKTIQQITIRDLMTMTAPYKYKSAPYTKYFTSDDWVKASLDLLGGKGEIGVFRYAPLIGPDILSGILTKATGKSAREYAEEKLFGPLGISVPRSITFETKEQQMEIMTRARGISGWVADPQGVNTTGWGLFLTVPDMAKLGQLYLNRGAWESAQLIPAGWIDESTSEHSLWPETGLRYGYLWWLIDDESFAAMGDGGNVIYVNPGRELVAALGATFKPRAADRIALIKEKLEPLWS